MTPLLHTVVVTAILVVSIAATPPSDHVKQPDDDKNPPSYQYNYEVEDVGGGQGKAEKREGEQATGQYYVKSKRSSTDVKYIADEWGYHPIVKYESSDDHSRSSTSFAIGENAVKDLRNPNLAQTTQRLFKEENRDLLQVIQPNNRIHATSTENTIINLNSNSTLKPYYTFSNFAISDVSLQPQTDSTSVIPFQDRYASSTPQQRIFVSPETKSSDIGQDTEFLSSLGNDISSTGVEEDKLVVENSGSFGQRLQIQNDEAFANTPVSASTASPFSFHSKISTTFSSSRSEQNIRSQTREKHSKQYLPDTIPGFGVYPSTASPLWDNSVTANSIESENVNAHNDGKTNIESIGLRTYSIPSGITFGSLSGTTPSPFLIKYASHIVTPSPSKLMNVEDNGNIAYVFSKPIVVPDKLKEKPFEYSTTFKCENDDDLAHTPDPLSTFKIVFSDTVSSHILNPIQAGVSLVNAGETHLLGNGGSKDEASPAPVTEKVDEVDQPEPTIIQVSNNINTRENNYVGVNPSFGNQNNEIQSQPQMSKAKTDQSVEIQKSIEIYQDLPKKMSNYVEQPTIIQLDQQSQIYKNLQQPSYFTNNADSNSKEISNTLKKIYEINGNNAKESGDDQPYYVVPPATYVLQDNSILKNNILYDKVYNNAEEVSDNLRLSHENLKLGENIGNKQLHNSFESFLSYEQQKVIGGSPEVKFDKKLEKTVHNNVYPVEKIIEKKIPYPVEKIIEKKVPIPQPYPVPIKIPVPEPFPIHIEKIIERKIPIPVHVAVPHPYPVEKPIHIPVPIEKIVDRPVHIPITVEKIIEKKVPVPHPYPVELEKIIERKIPYPVEVTKYVEQPIDLGTPYGIQYGVSYQQIMKPQKHGVFSLHTNSLSPLYALSIAAGNLHNNNNNNNIKTVNELSVNNANYSQPFQGYVYEKPAIVFMEGKENVENNHFLNSKGATKKLNYNRYTAPSYHSANSLLHRRHTAVHRSSKPERNEYVGPVPPLPYIPRQYGFQSKVFAAYPTLGDRMQVNRKGRSQEPVRHQQGNFRQSKMEYGFKPPMVPSVQYDEETASKVER